MDPLSISASIAGLVSLADLVFRATTKYVRGVCGSRKDVESLLQEVKNLSIVLHHLSLIAFDLEAQPTNDEEPGSSASTNLKPYHLHQCQQLLRRLENGLCDKSSHLNSSSAVERLSGRLKWPFSSAHTKEMLQEIQRQKQTIDLALAADSMAKLKLSLSQQAETKDSIKSVQDTVNKILDIGTKAYFDKRKKEVLNVFMKVNPHKEFETNRKLRHTLTGLWLTEGPDFDDWYTTPGSRVWFSGIPGAGKSVLAASIIEECGRRNGDTLGMAVAYFFCTYRDSRTHLFSSILSCLCTQLALQDENAYKTLAEYHNELKSKDHLPTEVTTEGLLKVLHRMCGFYDRVYFVIDGLDECGERVETTVKDLVDLSSSQSKEIISLALFSRDEVPIRHQVETCFRNIEIEAHTEDIQLYVTSELQQRIISKKLRLRDLTLKDQIMTKLVISGAKGMFRWVTCQLDHICELPTDRARKEALDRLPPTLPATYERILMRVESYNEVVKQLVQRTLSILVCPNSGILPFRGLCEAISVGIDSDTLFDDEIVEEQEVLRWCGSLVRTNENKSILEFAHFTVQEYLQGDCLKDPLLRIYGISTEKSYDLLGPLCLRFLTLKNHERLPEATEVGIRNILERQSQHPFYGYAATMWMRYTVDRSSGEDNFAEHLYRLFLLKKTPSFCSWAIEIIRRCLITEHDMFHFFPSSGDVRRKVSAAIDMISAVLRPDFTPLHMAAALGVPQLCRRLLEEGANIHLRSKFGTPFQCAIGGLTVFADVDLFSYSSTIGELRRHSCPPLARRQTVQLLLEAGSNPGLRLTTPFRSSTVLQLPVFSSMYGHDFEIVVDLVKAGVAVEQDDLRYFDSRYNHAISCFSPEKFSEQFNGGRAFTNLLEILGEQPVTTEPKSYCRT